MASRRVALPPANANDDSLESKGDEEESIDHILGDVPAKRGCTPEYDAGDEWVYTVPEEVTFKNYSAEEGKTMTRRLLVRISEDSPLSKRKIHISSPSIHRGIFSVKETLGGHEIEAGGTLILTVVFEPPDPAAGEPLDIQDWIQILDKPSKRVLQVPLRSIFKGTSSDSFYPPHPPPPIRPKTTGKGTVGPDHLLASVLDAGGGEEEQARGGGEGEGGIDPLAVLQAADALLEEVAGPLPSSSPQRAAKRAGPGGGMLGSQGGGAGAGGMRPGSVSWTEEELKFYQHALKTEAQALRDKEEEIEDEEVFPNWEGDETEKEFYKTVLEEEEGKLRESLTEVVNAKKKHAAAERQAQMEAEEAERDAKRAADPTPAFFIEQSIDAEGNIHVHQPSVLVNDASAGLEDVFLIDGVYVNALGEQVPPPLSHASHSLLSTTPGESLEALPEEEYTVSGRLVLEEEERGGGGERGAARRGVEEDEEEELMPWELPAHKANKLLEKEKAAAKAGEKGAGARAGSRGKSSGGGGGSSSSKAGGGGKTAQASALLAERVQAKQAGKGGPPQRIVEMGEKVVAERLRTSGQRRCRALFADARCATDINAGFVVGSGSSSSAAKSSASSKRSDGSLPSIKSSVSKAKSDKDSNWDALGS